MNLQGGGHGPEYRGGFIAYPVSHRAGEVRVHDGDPRAPLTSTWARGDSFRRMASATTRHIHTATRHSRLTHPVFPGPPPDEGPLVTGRNGRRRFGLPHGCPGRPSGLDRRF